MNFFEFILRLALATIYLVVATLIACGIFIALTAAGVAGLLLVIVVGAVGFVGYGIYQIVRYQLKRFIKKLSF
jgi:hypothetical protein